MKKIITVRDVLRLFDREKFVFTPFTDEPVPAKIILKNSRGK